MSSRLINIPGRDEAKPESQPMTSMEIPDTICPADWTKCPSSSSKVPRRDGSMRRRDCSMPLKIPVNTGST